MFLLFTNLSCFFRSVGVKKIEVIFNAFYITLIAVFVMIWYSATFRQEAYLFK